MDCAKLVSTKSTSTASIGFCSNLGLTLCEHFLTYFASTEGKNGHQFCTPSCVRPFKGSFYDSACSLFGRLKKSVGSHGGQLVGILIYAYESIARPRPLIEADSGKKHAAVVRGVRDPYLRTHYDLANSQINEFDWLHEGYGFVPGKGCMSSNQCGDYPALRAIKPVKAKPRSLPRQRHIRHVYIEFELVGCVVALPVF